jgi:hypothetical protein
MHNTGDSHATCSIFIGFKRAEYNLSATVGLAGGIGNAVRIGKITGDNVKAMGLRSHRRTCNTKDVK